MLSLIQVGLTKISTQQKLITSLFILTQHTMQASGVSVIKSSRQQFFGSIMQTKIPHTLIPFHENASNARINHILVSSELLCKQNHLYLYQKTPCIFNVTCPYNFLLFMEIQIITDNNIKQIGKPASARPQNSQ